MGSQRVRYDLATEQQQCSKSYTILMCLLFPTGKWNERECQSYNTDYVFIKSIYGKLGFPKDPPLPYQKRFLKLFKTKI